MARAFSVVTGGSNGIGAAIVRRLLGAGKAVINVDKVAPRETPAGGYVHVEADLSNPSATRRAAADIVQKYAVENLVNNAGASIPADLEEVTEDMFVTTMNLHLQAAIIFAQAAMTGMKQRRAGRIVNMSSRAALGKKAR